MQGGLGPAIMGVRMSEPEDFHPEDDFAALFEASTRASRFTKGQTVEGTIVGIGDEVALIDIGSKSEADMVAIAAYTASRSP